MQKQSKNWPGVQYPLNDPLDKMLCKQWISKKSRFSIPYEQPLDHEGLTTAKTEKIDSLHVPSIKFIG